MNILFTPENRIYDKTKEAFYAETYVEQDATDKNWTSVKDNSLTTKGFRLFPYGKDKVVLPYNAVRDICRPVTDESVIDEIMMKLSKNKNLLLIKNDNTMEETEASFIDYNTINGAGVTYLDILGDRSAIGLFRFEGNIDNEFKYIPGRVTDGNTYNNTDTPDPADVTPLFTNGKYGYALKVNPDHRFGVSTKLADYLDDELTVSFWFNWNGDYPTVGDTTYDITLLNAGYRLYELGIDSDGELVYAAGEDNWTWTKTGFKIDPDKWYHVTSGYNKSTGYLNIYINGELVFGDTVSASNKDWLYSGGNEESNYLIELGILTRYDAKYNISVTGYIDQVRLFKKVLNDNEASIVYNEALKCNVYDISNLNLEEEPKLITFKGNDKLAFHTDEEVFSTFETVPVEMKLGSDNVIKSNALPITNVDEEDILLTTKGSKVLTKDDITLEGTLSKANVFENEDSEVVAVFTFDKSTTEDLTGNHTAEVIGTEQYDDGVFGGKALLYDGSSYLKTNIDTLPDEFSLSFWYYPATDPLENTTDNNDNTTIFTISKDNSNTLQLWKNVAVSTHNGNVGTTYAVVAGTENPKFITSLDDYFTTGKWHHIVVTNNGNICINGKLVAEDLFEIPGSIINTPIVFGADIDDNNGSTVYNNFLSAGDKIDQIRITGRVLNSDEVYSLYKEQIKRIIVPSEIAVEGLGVLLPMHRPKNILTKTDSEAEILEPEIVDIANKDFNIITDAGTSIGNGELVLDSTVNNPDPFGDNSAVLFMPMDGNIEDKLGNYNPTWNGNELYTLGKYDDAAYFDGNTYINIGNLDDVFTQKSYTVSGWFQSDGSGTFLNIRNLDTDGSSADCKGGVLVGSSDSIYFEFTVKGTEDNEQKIYYFPKDIFNSPKLLTITHDVTAKTITLWINGVKSYTVAYTGDLIFNDGMTGLLGVHRYGDTLSSYLNGSIDQLRIFNRSLSPSEIQKLFKEEYKKIRLTYDLSQVPESLRLSKKIKVVDSNNIELTDYDVNTVTKVVKFNDVVSVNGFRKLQRGFLIDKPNISVLSAYGNLFKESD